MPVTTPKKIHFNEDAYQWLMALLKPNDNMHVNSTLQEYVANETKRDLRNKVEFMQNKP
jgi:spermidine/putrescine-binding protein